MNSAKYKNALYNVREITDMKDLVYSTARLYRDRNVYYVKDKPGGPYKPITYAKFERDVSAFGTALWELGLKDKNVAIIGENRYEWSLGYFSVVCGGGVIVPIDKELNKEEIGNLVERANVSAVIYSAKYEKNVQEAAKMADNVEFLIGMDLPEDEGNRKAMKELLKFGEQMLDAGRQDYLDKEIDPDSMSSLLFTSGTTGMAKGVMLSHKNIVSNVVNMSKYVQDIGTCGLSVLPMHHTYEMTCHICTAMYQGVAVAFCEGLKYIVKNLGEAEATVMLGVPLVFEKMHAKIWKNAEASGKADKMRKAIALSKLLGGQNRKSTKKLFKDVHKAVGNNLGLLIAGGAAIDPTVIEDFNAMGLPMIQGYGMTENAPIIAVNKDRYSKPAAAGLPMPGTEIKIIDKDSDGIGEIICKGPSVMMGYYNDPEETSKVLIDGWLHTGDYGYIDKDGFLFITGRKKNVIVTKNGKNIFPEEVEYYLQKSPYILEVVVWGRNDERSGDVVIYADIFPDMEFVKDNHGDISKEDLMKLLDTEIDIANEKMPTFKRVKRFALRDEEFEKNTSQKIMRHKIKR